MPFIKPDLYNPRKVPKGHPFLIELGALVYKETDFCHSARITESGKGCVIGKIVREVETAAASYIDIKFPCFFTEKSVSQNNDTGYESYFTAL